MNIEHISVSRTQTFQQCAQCYKYKYHLKYEPEGEEPFYFTYGKIIHKIVEVHTKFEGKKTIGEVASSVLNGEISLEREDAEFVKAPSLPNEYKKRMPEHLRAAEKLAKQVGHSGVCEFEFKYDLDPPHGRHVKGFIDRIIPKGDNYYIIDYKTSKKGRYRKNRSNIIYDPQLRLYARVIQKEFGVPAQNIKAALYYLEGGDLIGSVFSEKSLQTIEGELLEVYKEIEEMPAEAAWGNVGDWCKRCDYRRQCPFNKVS